MCIKQKKQGLQFEFFNRANVFLLFSLKIGMGPNKEDTCRGKVMRGKTHTYIYLLNMAAKEDSRNFFF